MHVGKLTGDNAANRVYRVLTSQPGAWIGGWDLTQRAMTSAVSTRVSEVRSQLDGSETIEVQQRGRAFYYRLVRERQQLEMAI